MIKINNMIKITEFAERHFDKGFGGTKILDMTPKGFEERVEHILNNVNIYDLKEERYNFGQNFDKYGQMYRYNIVEGYAPFCRLLFLENFTDARVGSLPITLENYQYLRSGYSARRDSELPTFSRWLELPLGKPKAEWLCIVLYDKEQIEKEGNLEELKEIHYFDYENEKKRIIKIKSEPMFLNDDGSFVNFEEWCDLNNYTGSYTFDSNWGIVAILGQSHSGEEPMKPETMLRNALGIEEGGSGVKLDREKYLKSIDFWSKNATVK